MKLSVQYMSFSAHADAKGIMQLIQHCEPKNVMLVHGEAVKMTFLRKKIMQEFSKYIAKSCKYIIITIPLVQNLWFIVFNFFDVYTVDSLYNQLPGTDRMCSLYS